MKRFIAGMTLLALLPSCAIDNLLELSTRYTKTPMANGKIYSNLLYKPLGDPKKNSVDLYLPFREKRPLLIFIHGGSWNSGDKDEKFVGQDVYANIGRFYYAKGYAVAVISYRLIPKVTWKEQAQDVAQAIHWLHQNPRRLNYDEQNIFLMGHSAGAQLALRVATDPRYLEAVGEKPVFLKAVVSLGSAGVDMGEAPDTRIDGAPGFLAKRFGHTGGDWRKEAAILPWIRRPTAPIFILNGSYEPKYFHRQARLLAEKLKELDIPYVQKEVAGPNHPGMVLAASQEGETSALILEFLRKYR